MENTTPTTGKTWVCSVCGYTVRGAVPPAKCPVCGVAAEYAEYFDAVEA